ncbi:MAG: DHHA1 domain-containing protein [Thermoplasmatota archaeon]
MVAGLDPRLQRRAQSAGRWVRQQGESARPVTVVHHIDADGLAAGAIALLALNRAGTPATALPVKSLDGPHVEAIRAAAPEALWFCDLGSTAYMHFPALPRLVCDHHQLVRDGNEESFAHLNPLLDGIDGQSISGAGCSYLAAAAADPQNGDLLPLALVGAAGDLQDRRGWQGTNRILVEAGIASGLLESRQDLTWFGSETRPLAKYLQLGRDPAVPGVSGDRNGAEGIAARLGGGAGSWSLQPPAVQRALRSALMERLVDCGLAADCPKLVREVVTIRGEAVGLPTRELQEFATLLNSTARYGKPDVGIRVAQGDRGAALAEARELREGHRRHLQGALAALERRPVAAMASLQWVHMEGEVLDTVVGIVAGMALDGARMRRDVPLVAFAFTPDGRTKASARAPHELAARGLDLAVALRDAAAGVGGQGGGHPGAAGATIPRGSEAPFLAAVDAAVGRQLRRA